jgi:hypothetical protein
MSRANATIQLYRKDAPMPSNVYLPSDLHYHEDLEREREETRYELALKRLTVSDVLATVDDMVQSESDMRKHPLHALARHCLRNGTYRTSGQRAYMSAHLGAVFEDLIDKAIEKLVQEELSNFGPWED